jgi:CHAD domain-containing protein
MGIFVPLRECYDRRVSVFLDRFAAASGHPSTDAVHDMRVALKRLRTFFSLAGAIGPGYDAEKGFSAARKLFRAAGKVRNLQVLEAKVYETSRATGLELSEYYNWLKMDELREAAKFGRACGRFREKSVTSAWSSMAASFKDLGEGRVNSQLSGRLVALITEIRQEKTMQRDVRRLHFLRTRTKEARYTLEVLRECGLTGDDAALLDDRLKDVHQPLGRWHDEEVLLESLGEFRKLRDPGPLFSRRSYLEFSRLTKARKAESLAGFEAAWGEFSSFLGPGRGQRVFLPSPGQPAADNPTPRVFGSPE